MRRTSCQQCNTLAFAIIIRGHRKSYKTTCIFSAGYDNILSARFRAVERTGENIWPSVRFARRICFTAKKSEYRARRFPGGPSIVSALMFIVSTLSLMAFPKPWMSARAAWEAEPYSARKGRSRRSAASVYIFLTQKNCLFGSSFSLCRNTSRYFPPQFLRSFPSWQKTAFRLPSSYEQMFICSL